MKQINDINFWKKVRKEFLNAGNNVEFICHASKEFEKIWLYFGNIVMVKDLAIIFLNEKNMPIKIATEGSFCLFYAEGINEDREIRIEFLNWIIERLEKKLLL